jgi:beta-glucosidase
VQPSWRSATVLVAVLACGLAVVPPSAAAGSSGGSGGSGSSAGTAARTSVVGTAVLGTGAGGAVDCAAAPWMDRRKGPDERARLVIAQMTLEEKVSVLGSVRDAEHFRETLPIPRLCIPALRMNNGSAGVSTGGPVQFPATALPAPLGLAATWDPGRARRYGAVAGRETRDQGRDLLEGPAVDLARVPVGGRVFEGYGEDPRLAADITVGTVKGIQSQGVMADVKHYAANTQEHDRNSIDAVIDERALREIYLPAYEAGVRRGGSASVMCAKNKVNGSYSCHSKELLTRILREEWKFPGFVISDFDSCHNTHDCINAGTEFELPQSRYFSVAAIRAAIAAGQVTEATVDERVRRIFTTMIRFGVFDRPRTTRPIDAAAGGAVARDIAQQAAVLLKNRAGTLPLDPKRLRSVAVVGPFAGAAHTGGGGSSRVLPIYKVNPVDGIAKRLPPGAQVRYAQGVAAGGPPAVPTAALNPPGQPGVNGLLGEYFPNRTFSGPPQVTRVDENVAFNFGAGEPAPELPTNNFSVRWTGTLTAPTTGDYVLGLTSDDGSRLYVDGKLAVDNWGTHLSRTVTETVRLDAGRHDIRIEYFDGSGSASVSFGWFPPGALTDVLKEAVDAARASDVAVVMVGDNQSEGRDATTLALSAGQDALVEAVAAANPRTVVVVKSGSPVLMPWVDKVPAILETWYPGSEDGNAVAALLFGEVNPSGKLPITFPKRDGDVPANTPEQYPGVGGVARHPEGVFVGYRHYDARGVEPLFPFGHGLSYTTFRTQRLRTLPLPARGHRLVLVDVTNTGRRAGSEVVQVYVGRPSSAAVPQPPRQLAAFAKVALAPGQTRRVVLHLKPRDFAYWDTARHGWVVPDGTYRIHAGTSSRNLPLATSVRIAGVPAAAADAPS